MMNPIIKTRDLVKALAFFYGRHKSQSILVLILMTLYAIGELFNIWLFIPLMGLVLNQNIHTPMLDQIGRQFGLTSTVTIALVLMLVTLLTLTFRCLFYVASEKWVVQILMSNQREITYKILNSNSDFFLSHNKGALVHLSTVSALHIAYGLEAICQIMSNILKIVLMVIPMAILFPEGTVVVALLGIVYLIGMKKWISPKVSVESHKWEAYARQNQGFFQDILDAYRTIRMMALEKIWQNKAIKNMSLFSRTRMKFQLYKSLSNAVSSSSMYIILALCALIIAVQDPRDMSDYGPIFVVFMLALTRLLPAVMALGHDTMILMEHRVHIGRVYEFLQEEKPLEDPKKESFKKLEKNIVFKNVSLQKNGQVILDNISLTIEKGQFVAFVGASGSGKTSLLSLLWDFKADYQGEILIDGRSLKDLSRSDWLSIVGIVPQDIFVFQDSIRENIALGSNYSDEELNHVMGLVGADSIPARSAEGLNMRLGHGGTNISGGERQRLGLARALIRKPDILVLDEATSSLDNVSEQNIYHQIEHWVGQKTVVAIAHRLSCIQKCDVIYVFDKGQVIEQGTHEQLLQRQGLYYKLYEREKKENPK